MRCFNSVSCRACQRMVPISQHSWSMDEEGVETFVFEGECVTECMEIARVVLQRLPPATAYA